MKPVPLIAALALLATPALADEANSAGASATPEKLVCKRVGRSDSRLPGPRVCRTRAEWQADEEKSQQVAREMAKSHQTTNGQ